MVPGLKHPVIFGKTWSSDYNPQINWKLHQVQIIREGYSSVQVQGGQLQGAWDEVPPDLGLMSKQEIKNALRSKAGVMMAMVRQVKEEREDGSHKEMEEVLSKLEMKELEPLIREFSDIFSADLPASLPPNRKWDLTIPMKQGVTPPSEPLYCQSPVELDALKEQLTYLIDKQLIRPSQSPYGSPVLLVPKPDGSLRLCIDYRALKRATIMTQFPLPLMDGL